MNLTGVFCMAGRVKLFQFTNYLVWESHINGKRTLRWRFLVRASKVESEGETGGQYDVLDHCVRSAMYAIRLYGTTTWTMCDGGQTEINYIRSLEFIVLLCIWTKCQTSRAFERIQYDPADRASGWDQDGLNFISTNDCCLRLDNFLVLCTRIR